jgi:hypothetical protein
MKPRIEDMTPELAIRHQRFAARMAEAGVPYALNSVLRTYAEQLAYAAQGRTFEQLVDMLLRFKWEKSLAKVRALHAAGLSGLSLVNRLRADAGMYLLDASENTYTVTDTLNSRHFPGPDGKATAFDIRVLRGDKKPTWDLKFDGDKDGIADYEEAARIGEEVGLTAGARWQKPDYPHFQLPA